VQAATHAACCILAQNHADFIATLVNIVIAERPKPIYGGTRNFLYAALDATACAAFIKESRMDSAGAASRTGNPKKGRSAMRLSIIVPARNEADVLRPCLESLLAQSEKGFAAGEDWELLLVDDGSTDDTRSIALGLAGVNVLDPAPLQPGWTGKANAVWTGARHARGEWLLFTDADTIHQAGNLRRAIHEAEHAHVVMLSYSPKQVVTGFWQRALMPLIFAELALAYPPQKVSDAESRVAAANGQFLMVQRAVYFQVGGHATVAGSLLEDVDFAFLLKRRKYPIRFRYAPDALSTKMYRSFEAMFEGWTKNLARLFGYPLMMAAGRALDLLLMIVLPLLLWRFFPFPLARFALAILWLRVLWRFYGRVAKSNFSAVDCAISVCALPLFCLLLTRSWWQHTVRNRVSWKGRDYSTQKQ
jgi:glycosyltransferase involved in cell wall biosynthesis